MKLSIIQNIVPLKYNLSHELEEYFTSFSEIVVFETREITCFAWDFAFIITIKDDAFFCIARDKIFKGFERLNGKDFLSSLEEVLNSIYVIQDKSFSLHPITRSLLGYLGFGFISLVEPSLSFYPLKDGDICFVFPRKQVIFDHRKKEGVFISDVKPSHSSMDEIIKEKKSIHKGCHAKDFSIITEKEEFLKNVIKAKEFISSGDIFQVVLSIRFRCDFDGNPGQLYKLLKRTNPSPYMFFFSLPHIVLMGTSPETLVRCRDMELEERPIAGTRSKPLDGEKISDVVSELISDHKERAEHVMLVDLSRNDLGRVAELGTVVVDKFMFVESFSHVIHITSSVKAKLKKELGAIDVLKATFPAGTVSGAPKIRAIEIISKLEEDPRGPYAGGVGWIGLDKATVNFDLAIIIRSLWIEGKNAFWQAGAGIVSDSKPIREWEECLNKAKVITDMLKKGGG